MEEAEKNDVLQTLTIKRRRKNKEVVILAPDNQEWVGVEQQATRRAVIELPALKYRETLLEAASSRPMIEKGIPNKQEEKEGYQKKEVLATKGKEIDTTLTFEI